jgi:hypothetical protein
MLLIIAALGSLDLVEWSMVENAREIRGQTRTIMLDGETVIAQIAGVPVLGMGLQDALSMFHGGRKANEVQTEAIHIPAIDPTASDTCAEEEQDRVEEQLSQYYSKSNFTSMQGYFISTSNTSLRFNSSSAVISRAGVTPVWVEPISASQFKDKTVPKAWSLKYTHHHIWDLIGKDERLHDEDWALVFEDDIALHPQLHALSAAQLSVIVRQSLNGLASSKRNRGTGFAFLGVCGPTFEEELSSHGDSRPAAVVLLQHSGVQISTRRGHGLCLHAYALQKRRAGSLLRDMRRFLPSTVVEQPYIDVTVRDFLKFKQSPALTVGANLVSPQAGDHIGMFFQDRESYPSTADAPPNEAREALNSWEHTSADSNYF